MEYHSQKFWLMSTKNTAQNKKLNLQSQLDTKDLYDSPIFLELSKKLASDLSLRKFFVGRIFTELFNDKGLCEFIKSTSLFPAAYLESTGYQVLDYFNSMRINAESTFKRELSTTFENVCSKACDINIFEPQSYIIDTNGAFHFTDSKKDSTKVYATFYKVLDTLLEPWIKAESHGIMLEAWIYALVKDYLKKFKFKVLHNVKIIEKEKKINLKTLVSEAGEKVRTVSDVDCLITQQEHPVGFLQCKMDKKFDWEDVRAFCGDMHLLRPILGAIIIGHNKHVKTDRFYGNVAIFPNVIEREDFPDVLFEFLNSKLNI
jgi:hypothetical protein